MEFVNSFNGDEELMMVQKLQGIRRVVSDEYVRESSLKRGPPHPHHNSESDVHQPLNKKRKRVRIQVEPLQVVEPQPLPPIDKGCWYSKADLVLSRKKARKLSSVVNTDPVLMEAYHKACELTADEKQQLEAPVASRDDEPTPHHNHQKHHKARAVELLKHSSAFRKQRGLERLSKNHAVSRSIQVCSVKSVVLLEQTSQYLDGVHDPERLAHASRMVSSPSQHFAQMLAMADQAMADKIYEEAARTGLQVLPSQQQLSPLQHRDILYSTL